MSATSSGLDWKIWFVAFAVLAIGVAFFLSDDVETATEVELGSDHVDQSVNSHTLKNREASDVLSSIAKEGQ